MANKISRFNPQRMSEEDVLALATGRETMLKIMLEDMQDCLEKDGNQHFIFYGPRGIGKSFFTRLLSIHHNRSEKFVNSRFIMLPEEQSNINYVADILDMISIKLEGKLFSDMTNRWDITDADWRKSKQRLLDNLANIRKEEGINHVFFTMENLQDFIPKLDAKENGRMREFLSDFEDVTLIGSSLHPDIDNDYSKKLFQVFKKVDIIPWKEEEYISYYHKKAKQKGIDLQDNKKIKELEYKIKAIAKFTGGSPRLAVILNGLVIDDDILSTCEIMDGIIDELTPYYQDLTKDIPPRSKLLFDLLIRLGENITQSELAANLNPAQEQKTIARSFKWLTDNFYVESIKQKSANIKHYYVRDRLYVLYYQNREVMADQPYSFIETFVDFLTTFYAEDELKKRLIEIDELHSHSKSLLMTYLKKFDSNVDKNMPISQMKGVLETLSNYFPIYHSLIVKGKYLECIEMIERKSINQRSFIENSGLGVCYLGLGNYTMANSYFLKLVEEQPDNQHFLTILGLSSYFLQDYEKAKVSFKNAIKIEPNHIDANLFLGNIYVLNKEYKNAFTQFAKVIDVDSNNWQGYCELGKLNYTLEDFEKAYQNLKKVLELNPYHKEASAFLISIYLKKNQYRNIESLINTVNELNSGVKLITDGVNNLLGENKSENFHEIKKVLTWLEESKPKIILPFVSSLFATLYKQDNKDLLSDILGELKSMKLNDSSLNVNLQAWQYLLNPDEIDLASLHPDARIAVQAVLGEE